MAKSQDSKHKQKENEARLLESQARLSEAQRIAHIGNWEMDLNTKEMYWSDEAYRIFDLEPQQQQIFYKMFLDTIHPEDRDFVDQTLAGSAMARKPFDFMHRLETTGGKTRHVSLQGEHLLDESDKPIRTIGTIQDITKQVMVRQVLEKSERRYRLLAENSSDVIWTMDLEGNYTYVSPSIERLSGYNPQEIMNHPMGASLTPESLETAKKVLADFIQAYRQGESFDLPDRYELEQICKDGTVIWVEISIDPITDGQKNLQGILGVSRDITRRVQLGEQLRQSQRLEAVGRLAGGVAHDFNNLLMVVQSSVGFALEAVPEKSELRDDLLDIQTAGKRAKNLTRQLLAFSRRQLLQPKVLDLNTLVGSMNKMLSLIGEDIDLEIIPGRNIGKVRVDPGQIEQVIMNLAVNARDAMPTGGCLTIETSDVEIYESSAEKNVDLEPGHYVMIAVSDNGTGMDPETCSRVFDPFFTTKEVGKGTGLGLSTTHGILKQSGGDISVDSRLGKGTTFTIYLPRLKPDTIATKPSKLPSEPPAGGEEVILVVEDDEAVRNLTVRILERQGGYSVLQADGLAQALKVSDQSEERIDLLLTDVVMPGASGREVAEILSDIHSGLKVLFMSGYNDDDILRHGLSAEKIAFIQKPFNSNSLCSVVREILDAQDDVDEV